MWKVNIIERVIKIESGDIICKNNEVNDVNYVDITLQFTASLIAK